MFSRLCKRFRRVNFYSGELREADRETSSPGTVLSKKQAKNEKKRLIKELQLITEERNDLRDRLMYVTEKYMNNRPYFSPNPLYEKLERKEKDVMSLLHNLEMENTEIRENIQELKKENNFSRNLQNWLLMENKSVKMMIPLNQVSKEVQLDCALIQKYLVDLNKNSKDEQGKTINLQTQQHLKTALERELGELRFIMCREGNRPIQLCF